VVIYGRHRTVQLLHFAAAPTFMESSPRLLDSPGIFTGEITSEGLPPASPGRCGRVRRCPWLFAMIVIQPSPLPRQQKMVFDTEASDGQWKSSTPAAMRTWTPATMPPTVLSPMLTDLHVLRSARLPAGVKVCLTRCHLCCRMEHPRSRPCELFRHDSIVAGLRSAPHGGLEQEVPECSQR